MNQSTVDSNKEGIFRVVYYEQEENGQITGRITRKRPIFAEAEQLLEGKIENISIKLEPTREKEEEENIH